MRLGFGRFEFITGTWVADGRWCSYMAGGVMGCIPSTGRLRLWGASPLCNSGSLRPRTIRAISGPLPPDFHRRAAEETLLVLDALGIDRAVFWGHSDGSVIAAMIGLVAPERCEHLLLEAFHFRRDKPSSHNFFQRFATHPEEVSEKVKEWLVADHDAAHWRHVVQRNCRVWLKLAAESARPGEDLYNGRLGQLTVPVTFVHGRRDPRTEPGEMERAHGIVVWRGGAFYRERAAQPTQRKRSLEGMQWDSPRSHGREVVLGSPALPSWISAVADLSG